jgi:hypothetical protein
MSSSLRPARDSSIRVRPTSPEEVTISDWALRDRPLASSVAMTLAAGATWLAVWATNNWIIGVLVAVALALTLWRTWLPIQYELSASGITQRVLHLERRIPWTAVRAHEIKADGVLFLPDDTIAPASPLRGLYLHWGAHREQVLAQIHYHLPTRPS